MEKLTDREFLQMLHITASELAEDCNWEEERRVWRFVKKEIETQLKEGERNNDAVL